MGAPQYEQAGADIGGTGTTNYIPRWTGPSTLGDSGLIDNGTAIYTTTRFVGIGTTSPASALHVRNNTAGITLDSTLGGGRQYQLNPLRTGLSNAGFEIRDVTASATVISFDATQQVGIGTASPGTRLHVLASAAPIATLASSQATQGYLQLNYNTSTTFGYIGNGASVIGGGAAGDLGLRSDTGVISFATGGNTERARIDSSGNVGIGVTPISPLHVKGNATNTDGILTLTPNTGGRNHQVQSLQASSLFRIFDQSAGASRLEIDINGNISATTTGGTFNASTTNAGIKLPATPGNTDTQTLDCYQENTWTATDGSGASLTFTVNNTAVYTRVGRLIHARIDITFPSTANGSNALVNLPFNSIAYGGTSFVYASGVGSVMMVANAAGIEFYTAAGVRMTNSALSTLRIIGSIVYQAS